ncbi:MAG: NAD(P)-binding protein [Pseudomonadota bacterium]
MATAQLEADYLIIGAGAQGLAFADVLVNETDASVVITDRHARPGGHWNDAYPFVRLHQPSAFYGVNSRTMGDDRIDEVGRNKGMMELASVSEIMAYYDQVMRHTFLPTGRVTYLPQSDYLGEGKIRNLVTGEENTVTAKKTVDSTYMKVKVPQVTPPPFKVADGVDCVPPNALEGLYQRQGVYEHFVVVGAGKTALDTILYLMDLGIAPDTLTWIKPRDSWLFDRAMSQPDNFYSTLFMQAATVAESESLEEVFERLEGDGGLLRVDRSVKPEMFRCAVISKAELEDLRKVKNVIRMGRVTELHPGKIVLEQGTAGVPANTLFVNCTADGLESRPAVPVFNGNKITIQPVRTCQQVFSAAFIAFLDRLDMPDAEKNELTVPVPHPDTAEDFLGAVEGFMCNQLKWLGHAEVFKWLVDARLDGIVVPKLAEELKAGTFTPDMAATLVNGAMTKITRFRAAA